MGMKYIFFGHHKAASTWIALIIKSICARIQIPCISIQDLSSAIDYQEVFILDVNSDYERTNSLEEFKGFHVIRDPRDIVVSAYFSHRYSHPQGDWLEQHRSILWNVPRTKGINLSIDFRSKQFERMSKWNYQDTRIYETKFEILTSSPFSEFKQILSHLGLAPRLSTLELKQILDAMSFKKLSGGREKGQEDYTSHYRQGLKGNWREYFDQKNIRYFEEKHPELLSKLGYLSER